MPTYRSMSTARLTADVATVECHKQVRSWRLLRALMELLIPTCNCTFVQETPSINNKSSSSSYNSGYLASSTSSSGVITGTIFGSKRGKVKFCVQQLNGSVLLLELAIPTSVLAREMRGGLLRIALECTNSSAEFVPLLEMPVWRMYCNGRRVGFAVRRRPSKADVEVMRRMSGVVVGAGVVSGKEVGCEDDDDVMYLRGNFERVRGSSDAESFHFIDPDGNINQDLSIFFLRSR